jgi:hypothetical protein
VDDDFKANEIFSKLNKAENIGGSSDWLRIRATVENYLGSISPQWTAAKIRYWARRARQFTFVNIRA